MTFLNNILRDVFFTFNPVRTEEMLPEWWQTKKGFYETIAADLFMPEAAQQIYDTCKENGWQVDYLINNAGFGGQGDFARERTMEHDRSTSRHRPGFASSSCRTSSRGGMERCWMSPRQPRQCLGRFRQSTMRQRLIWRVFQNALWKELQDKGDRWTKFTSGRPAWREAFHPLMEREFRKSVKRSSGKGIQDIFQNGNDRLREQGLSWEASDYGAGGGVTENGPIFKEPLQVQFFKQLFSPSKRIAMCDIILV